MTAAPAAVQAEPTTVRATTALAESTNVEPTAAPAESTGVEPTAAPAESTGVEPTAAPAESTGVEPTAVPAESTAVGANVLRIEAPNAEQTARQVITRPSPPTAHPIYRDFAEVVDTVIAPRAVEVDATEVPLSHIAALREVGYFSWFVPAEYGGTAVPTEVKYAASELLFGACPSTALAVTQHGGPVGLALKSKSKAALALLPQLATGERIGTTGLSQIRTWKDGRSLFARKLPGGYRLDGPVTYLSGFGLADIANLGAADAENNTFVFGIVDLNQPGITGEILELAAVRGSRTAALHLDNVFVPDELIGEVTNIDEWLAKDGIEKQAQQEIGDGAKDPFVVGPIGIGRAALADALEVFPDEPSLLELSEELERAAVTPLRAPYWRAQLDEIVVRATLAGLVARGGRGLNTNNIAQVRARAAFFLQVRGLSAPMRIARFEKLAHIDNSTAI